jgi:hypothetical protein
MEKFRLGSLAELQPFSTTALPDLTKSLSKSSLIIEAPYLMARRAVRTRLEKDRSAHRIMNGMVLWQHHYFASDSCREGFPQFRQYFLFFGYYELENRLMNQVISQTVFTRYELELHFWLMIPKSLGEMAAQWGDGFMNLQMFPYIKLDSTESGGFNPMSTACSTAPPGVAKKYQKRLTTDPSFQESGSPQDFDDITQGDVKFEKKKKPWGGR